jgi:general stress protein 26
LIASPHRHGRVENPIDMSKKPTRETLWAHIQAIKTCMMVTHEDGEIRARPMRGIPHPDENAIWFFADSEGRATEGWQQNSAACLTFVDSRDNVFVSLSGRLSRVFNPAKIKELWDEQAASYFSDGPDDARVILLRFRPDTGEFWAAPSSPIVIAIKFLEATLMGERPNLGTKEQTQLP